MFRFSSKQAGLISLGIVAISFIYQTKMRSLEASEAILAEVPALSDHYALVVGGTAGIGLGIADLMATKLHINVAIAGRNEVKAQEYIDSWKQQHPNGKYTFHKVDASSVKDSIRLAEEIAQTFPRLDYLILTPGIFTFAGRTETAEHLDQKMALHYYSRAALMTALVPFMEKSITNPQFEGKVLSVLDATQGRMVNKDDLDLKEHFSVANAAQACTLYNSLLMEDYAKKYPRMSFFHALPGVVKTDIGRESPYFLKPLMFLIQPFIKTKEQCATYMTAGIMAPDRKEGWFLLKEDGSLVKPVPDHNDENRELVVQHTERILNEILSEN